jgi:hypothetical protein
MTSAPAIVTALVLAIAAGRLLRHFGDVLRHRPSGRSTEMTTPHGTARFPLRVYHWRWEIVAVTLLPYGLVAFARWAGPAWSAAVLATVLATAFLRRRQVRVRVRAVVLQHRLRAAFPLLRLPGGRRPAILWTRPRGGDVVVSLYGREAFEDLHRRRTVLAEVLSVPEVYVDRHPKFASLVTLTISTTEVRREPGRAVLPSNVVPLRAHS